MSLFNISCSDRSKSLGFFSERDSFFNSLITSLENFIKLFINIINNARDAIRSTQRAGTLTIETDFDKKYVIVRFIDTGQGFSSYVADKLFTPFFTTKKEGIGMGLNIAKKIIDKYEGEIKISRNKPSGAIVTVKIPRMKT